MVQRAKFLPIVRPEPPPRVTPCEKFSKIVRAVSWENFGNFARYSASALTDAGIQFLANHVSWGGAFLVASALTRTVITFLRESGHELDPKEEAILTGVLTPIFLNWISEGPGITCATMQWALSRARHRFNQKVQDIFGTPDYLGVPDHPAAAVFSHMILTIGYSLTAALKQRAACQAVLDGHPIPGGPTQGIDGPMPTVIGGGIVAAGAIAFTSFVCGLGKVPLKAPPVGSDQEFRNWNSGSARAALEGTGRNDALFFGFWLDMLSSAKLVYLRDYPKAAVIVPAALAGARMWCLCASGWFPTGRQHRGPATPADIDPKLSRLLLDCKMPMTEAFLRREASDPANRKVGFPARQLRMLGEGFTPSLAFLLVLAMTNIESDVLTLAPEVVRQILDSDADDNVKAAMLAFALRTAERLLSEERAAGIDPGLEERRRNLRRSYATAAGVVTECGFRYVFTDMRARGALAGMAAGFIARKAGSLVSAAAAAARRLCGDRPAAPPKASGPAVVAAEDARPSRLEQLGNWCLKITSPFYVPWEMGADIWRRAHAADVPLVPEPHAAAVAATGAPPHGRESKYGGLDIELGDGARSLRMNELSKDKAGGPFEEDPQEVPTASRRLDVALASSPLLEVGADDSPIIK
jgi:hypothetical protein